MMAFDDKQLKQQEDAPTEEVESPTVSDHSSVKSQLPFQDVQEHQPCFSQGSFGGKSQISSTTVAQEMPSQQTPSPD